MTATLDDTDDRQKNPSGLPDDDKQPQPVPDEHHEDGHDDA